MGQSHRERFEEGKLRFNSFQIPSALKSFLKNLKEGFIFTYDFLPIRYAFGLQIIICFMAMTHINLMPIFTQKILSGNAETMGLLMTASAFGSIVSGLYLILRKQVIGLEKVITRSTVILGLSLMLFSHSKNLEICLVLIFLVGMSNTLTLAAIGNFVQSILITDKKALLMHLRLLASRSFLYSNEMTYH
ncbi:MFS transporter [Scytonema sp. NUACC26]|uniref:MFS transporter n=1 Tax=Scytonema sp. NUACC26 TaxID=3140176 RepID=UPI0034DBA445